MKRLLILNLLFFTGPALIQAAGADGMAARVIEVAAEEMRLVREIEQLARNKEEVEKTLKVLKEEECPVCMEEFEKLDDVWLLPKKGARCGHAFHPDCIVQAATVKLECPSCRENLSPADVPPLPEEEIDLDVMEGVEIVDELLQLIKRDLSTVNGINKYSRRRDVRVLNLNQNNISSLPENAFEGFEKLEKLHLFENHLHSVHQNAFHGLRNLTFLGLGGANVGSGENQLQLTAETLAPLVSLERLDLSENDLTAIPDWVNNLGNLKELDLENNRLRLTAGTFVSFPLLEQVDLDDNQLETLPVGVFSSLHNLKKVFLDYNHFSPEEQERIRQEILAASPECETTFEYEGEEDESDGELQEQFLAEDGNEIRYQDGVWSRLELGPDGEADWIALGDIEPSEPDPLFD
jgi:hypothetical protein